MKLSERVRPISHLKAHAPEVIRDLTEHREPVIVTLHGEAKAILQDIDSYEETQKALVLLKVLALTGKSVADGKIEPAGAAFARLRARLKS